MATQSQIVAYARLKPSLGVNQAQELIYGTDETDQILEVIVPKGTKHGPVNNAKDCYQFKFAKVFSPMATQDEVFEQVASPVVDSCLDGYNGTIFAYGQTGSGKTFTMSGGDSWEERGVIPRAFTYLFD